MSILARSSTITTSPAVIPLPSEPPPRLVVEAPHPEQLKSGRVVIAYRAENVRIVPIYGEAALQVSPRVGHLHITVDDLPWHWLDASGEAIALNGFHPGRHKVLVELADATHHIVDRATVTFEIPRPIRSDP
ncbi:MAG TPA: DUF6130 family protein [Tepidisphaeraceae bacterium]|jgi:hypothetical protein